MDYFQPLINIFKCNVFYHHILDYIIFNDRQEQKKKTKSLFDELKFTLSRITSGIDNNMYNNVSACYYIRRGHEWFLSHRRSDKTQFYSQCRDRKLLANIESLGNKVRLGQLSLVNLLRIKKNKKNEKYNMVMLMLKLDRGMIKAELDQSHWFDAFQV